MGNGLGIGLADEFATLFAQLLTQLAEILDDAVMDNRNQIGGMRMSIILARPAVRRPARMTDADTAAERLLFEPHLQRAKLTFSPPPAERAAIQRCHSSGVVSSI